MLQTFCGLLGAATAPEPFFAPPQPSGAITVKLHPMENVAPGTAALVTFGVPFPRASVSVQDLARIRVLRHGVEIPAAVKMATPWRQIGNPSASELHVRVATVQILYTFAVRYPAFEEIAVEWGSSPRSRQKAFENPRAGWHTVTSGSFAAADKVSEPDVYALLPKDHLSNGSLLLARTIPFADDIPEERDDPAAFKARTDFPGLQLMDYSFKNNFYTAINLDDPRAANVIDYRKDFEPWLYDRVATFFVLYLRTGFLKALREAVQNADFFRSQIADERTTPAECIGIFQLKRASGGCGSGSNTAMYSNVEGLAYSYWLTGDDLLLPPVRWAVNHHNIHDLPSRWNPKTGLWTERGTGLNTLANVVGFELFGDRAYAERVKSAILDYSWHQDGAGGLLPANRVDGPLYHMGFQHGDGLPSDYVASPWMTVLVVNALVRAYAVTEDPLIPEFLVRVARWEAKVLRHDGEAGYDTSPASELLRYPAYVVRADGSTSRLDADSAAEHSLPVAAAIAWGSYFARLLGKPEPGLDQAVRDLYLAYTESVGYWVRPAAPASRLTAFRLGPPRKLSWEHRPSASLSWLTQQNGTKGAPRLRIRLKSPVAGAASKAPGSFQLSVEALTGVPDKIEFFGNGQTVGSAAKGRDTAEWMGVPAGTYLLSARATDAAGEASCSQEVAVAVLPEDCVQAFGFDQADMSFPMQSGTFSVSAAITPLTVAGITGSPGISVVQAPTPKAVLDNSYPLDISAAALKFDGETGKIAVRDGESYRDTGLSWSPGITYRVHMELDTAARTYRTLLAPGEEAEREIAAQSRFHPLYAGSYAMLNAVRAVSDGGAIASCRREFPAVETAPPPAPSALSAVMIDSRHVDLTWITPDRADYVTIERKALGGDFVVIGKLGADGGVFVDQDVSPLTAYQYRCAAVNGRGISVYSAVLAVKTPEPGGTIVALRQGEARYEGATDLSIANKFAEGNVFRDSELVVWDLSGPTGYVAKALLRFDDLPVPEDAEVTSARLSLTFSPSWADFVLGLYRVNAAWDSSARSFGWFYRTAGEKWGSPGAGAEGSDFRSEVAATFTVDGDTSVLRTVEVPVDPAVVQEWVRNRAANHGLLLVNQVRDATARIHSMRSDNLDRRPRLTISYRRRP